MNFKTKISLYFLLFSALISALLVGLTLFVEHYVNQKIISAPILLSKYLPKGSKVTVNNLNSKMFFHSGILKVNVPESVRGISYDFNIPFSVRYNLLTPIFSKATLNGSVQIDEKFKRLLNIESDGEDILSYSAEVSNATRLDVMVNSKGVKAKIFDKSVVEQFLGKKIDQSDILLKLNVDNFSLSYSGSIFTKQPKISTKIENLYFYESGLTAEPVSVSLRGINSVNEFNLSKGEIGLISDTNILNLNFNKRNITLNGLSIVTNSHEKNTLLYSKSDIKVESFSAQGIEPSKVSTTFTLKGLNISDMLELLTITRKSYKAQTISNVDSDRVVKIMSDTFKNGFNINVEELTFQNKAENFKSNFGYIVDPKKSSPFSIMNSSDIYLNLLYAGSEQDKLSLVLTSEFGVHPVYLQKDNKLAVNFKFSDDELKVNDKKGVSPILNDLFVEILSMIDSELGFIPKQKMNLPTPKENSDIVEKLYIIRSYDPSKQIDKQIEFTTIDLS